MSAPFDQGWTCGCAERWAREACDRADDCAAEPDAAEPEAATVELAPPELLADTGWRLAASEASCALLYLGAEM